uniref:NADH-ubiquinone oxidoreductase chain 2 n=1 Tax=Pectinodonta sp. TaxID=3071117 RepID=A0AA96HTR1_9GAST|nr:NADH dehydrogenase subunit 2 [Pectinodonta sp.]
MFFLLPFGSFFVFLMIFGTVISICSFHWLFIWVGFEINLMGFIPLLMYSGLNFRAECGVKYFLVQALGSVMFVVGSVLVFSSMSSWDLSPFLEKINNSGVLGNFGIYFFCFSLLLKLGCFPFYFWVPSVVMGGSWFSCFLLLTWQKISPFFVLIMSGSLFFSDVFWVVLISAIGSSIFGGLGGIGESFIRPLMAYSSISHSGWMLLSCVHGLGIFMIYFMIYFFISCCIFMLLSLVGDMSMSFSNSEMGEKKLIEWGIIGVLLSLAGVPPFLGFLGKWIIVSVSMGKMMVVTISFLIFGSLLSVYYYFLLFFGFFFAKFSFLSISNSLVTNNYTGLVVYVVLGVSLVLNLFGSMICMLI